MSGKGSKVVEIKDENQFNEFIKEGLCVIDFYALWCKPCKLISPVFHEQSGIYTNLKFGSVNVEELPSAQISTVPTFKFYKDGQALDFKVVGMNAGPLKLHIQKFSETGFP